MGTITADHRVKDRPGGGYDVAANDTTYHVLSSGNRTGWGIYHGPGLDLVPMPGGPGGFAWQFPTAEDAINVLLSSK